MSDANPKDYVQTFTAKGRVYHYLRPSAEMKSRGVRRVRLTSDDPVSEAKGLIDEFLLTQTHSVPRFENHVRMILRKAKRRSEERGIEFDLTEDDVAQALRRSRLKCEVTGLPFRMEVETDSYRQPWRPSIDRISAAGGYTPKNIRMVCVAVNVAMADWGEDVFWAVVQHARRGKGGRPFQENCQTVMSNSSNLLDGAV